MVYFKSIYTEQCYMMDHLPAFGGYVEITEEEYFQYWRDQRIAPPEVRA